MQEFYGDSLTLGDLCDRCYRAYYKHRKEKGQLGLPVNRKRTRTNASEKGEKRQKKEKKVALVYTSSSIAHPPRLPKAKPSTTNIYNRFSTSFINPDDALVYANSTASSSDERGSDSESTASSRSRAEHEYDHEEDAEEQEDQEEEDDVVSTGGGGDYRFFNSVMYSKLYRSVPSDQVSSSSAGCSPNQSPFLTCAAVRGPSPTHFSLMDCEIQFEPTHNDHASAPSRRKRSSPHKSARPSSFMEQMQPCDFLWKSSAASAASSSASASLPFTCGGGMEVDC